LKLEEYNKCRLRSIFDPASDQWTKTTMEEKIQELSLLLQKDQVVSLKLALGMLDECKSQNKDIELLDIVISMSKIIDFLLKK